MTQTVDGVYKIKNREEFFDIVTGYHEDFDIIQKDADVGKHDRINYVVLVKNKRNGEYYGLCYEASYNDGIKEYNEYPLCLKPITPKEIKRFEYEMSY